MSIFVWLAATFVSVGNVGRTGVLMQNFSKS